MGKIVPATKFTELKGLDRVAATAHEMRCLFREISKDDFGLDGEIEVLTPKRDGNGYETTGGIIKVQAKSGQSYVKLDTPTSFATPVSKADLEYWIRCTFPVFLIVYHPTDDKLYFKEVKSYVRSTAAIFQAPLQIEFDKHNDEFAASSRALVCQHANISPSRVSFDQQERLLSNLLPIRRLPKWLYSATTRDTWQSIKENLTGFRPPGCVFDGKVYSFANLAAKECALRDSYHGPVTRVAAKTWIRDDARLGDFIFMLNQLLGIHARRCGIRYNREFRRNYFPRENNDDTEFRRDWTSVRTGKPARRRLVAKHYEYSSKEYGTISFWRHLAAQISYRQFGSSWFLQIIPRYLFTTDGVKPWDSELVGPYTTMIKAREHNSQVLNHVLFWSDVLSQHKPDIKMRIDDKTLLKVEKLPVAGVTHFAIPDDPAIFEEKAPSTQLPLFDVVDEGEEDPDDDDDY